MIHKTGVCMYFVETPKNENTGKALELIFQLEDVRAVMNDDHPVFGKGIYFLLNDVHPNQKVFDAVKRIVKHDL